jgi:hypothetical protein
MECTFRFGEVAVVVYDADRASGALRRTTAADSEFLGKTIRKNKSHYVEVMAFIII